MEKKILFLFGIIGLLFLISPGGHAGCCASVASQWCPQLCATCECPEKCDCDWSCSGSCDEWCCDSGGTCECYVWVNAWECAAPCTDPNPPPSCTATYFCNGNDRWRRESNCGEYFVESCGSTGSWSAWTCKSAFQKERSRTIGGCNNGQCIANNPEKQTIDCPYGCIAGKCQPKAEFTITPNELSPNTTVNLNAGNSKDPYGTSCGANPCLSYQWYHNNNPIGNTKTLNYILPTGSQQTIRLVVTTSGLTGETRTPDNGTTHEMTRSRNTVIRAPDTCTLPCNITIDAVGTTDDKYNPNQLTYQWDYTNDGTTDATYNNPNQPGNYTYPTPGNHTIKLTVTNPDALKSMATKSIQVINNPPNANFKMIPSPASGIVPLTITFIDTLTPPDGSTDPDGHTITSWQWSFGDGSTGTGQQTSNTYTIGTNYTVTLTVTDQYGATGTIQKTVQAKEKTLITALKANNPPTPDNELIITVNCTKTVLPIKIEIFDKQGNLITTDKDGNPLTNPLKTSTNNWPPCAGTLTPAPPIKLPSGVYLLKATIVKADGSPEPECSNCPKTTNITVGMQAPEMQTPEMPAILAAGIALVVVLVANRKK